MMNQWTGTCDTGETVRDICPILADDLPRCVNLEYSFWVCMNARPRNANQCDEDFVNGFCTPYTSDRVVEMCNGDRFTLETVSTGFGEIKALTADKNGYGLEINVEYFWLNPGNGEDRRSIETSFSDSDMWLCNAQMNPDQATAVKYSIVGGAIATPPPSVAMAI
ncbi:MAG: hypothetical protein SGARI_007600, partial [Bacillariaceae sp.]